MHKRRTSKMLLPCAPPCALRALFYMTRAQGLATLRPAPRLAGYAQSPMREDLRYRSAWGVVGLELPELYALGQGYAALLDCALG